MFYEVRRPIESTPSRWNTALTVSRHRTLSGAERSLQQQRRGALHQGGYSQDRVCRFDGFAWVPLTDAELDNDTE